MNLTTVLEEKIITFTWYDYILVAILLGLSILIGIYYGFIGSKQSTIREYLMGSNKMGVISIATSAIASQVSGITMLALPADIYLYGSIYIWTCLSIIATYFINCYLFLPVFFNLQIKSSYEYLERRFDYKIRIIGSVLFVLYIFLYLPVVIYIPALAFSTVTNWSVHSITPIMCGICVFYTTIGGLKAVVWTDNLQFVMIAAATALVTILGTISSGGFKNIWDRSLDGQRLDVFDFDIDLTKKDTFWAMVFGFGFKWFGEITFNQGYLQKFLSISTLKEAKRSVLIFIFGFITTTTATVFTGLILFALYGSCDVFTLGGIKRNDQLVPYYVLDVAGKIPGLPGLYIAGILCAALSTLSAYLNSVAGTIYEDFVSKMLPKNTSEKFASNTLKVITVLVGIVCTALVFVVENLGSVWHLTVTLTSIAGSISIGLFLLGMLFPTANTKGALYGSIIGLLVMLWISMSSQYYTSKGLILHPKKPLSTEGCSPPIGNSTLNMFTDAKEPESPVFLLYRVSVYYYTIMGSLLTITIGLIVSFFTAEEHDEVPEELLSPLVHFILKRKEKSNYYSIEKALGVVRDDEDAEIKT